MEPEILYIICSYLDGIDIKIMSFLYPEDRNIQLISDFCYEIGDHKNNKFLNKLMENRAENPGFFFTNYSPSKSILIMADKKPDDNIDPESLSEIKVVAMHKLDLEVFKFLHNLDELCIYGFEISAADIYNISKLKNLIKLEINIEKKNSNKLNFPKLFVDSGIKNLSITLKSNRNIVNIKNLPIGLRKLIITINGNTQKIKITDRLEKLERLRLSTTNKSLKLEINKNNNVNVLAVSKYLSISEFDILEFEQTGLMKISRICTNWELTNFTDYKIPELLMAAAASNEAIKKNMETFCPDFLITYNKIELTKK